MKNNKTFSVIIPTYRRKENLLNLLETLPGKIGKKDEVIIVEQKENNSKEFKLKAEKLGINLKYFFLPNPSTPMARNIGIKKATNDNIVFFDDDVLLKTKISPFVEITKPNIAAVGGRVITVGQPIEPKNKNTGKITKFGNSTDGFSSTIPQTVDTVIGCNSFWKKQALLEIGGFDELFTGNAIREETDACLRLKEKGYKIEFNPNVLVEHIRAESGGARKTEGRIKWYFDFFSNETYFYLKHMNKIYFPIFLILRINWILRCMFGFGREISARSFSAPFLGISDGVKKYRRYKNDNWS